MSRVSIPKEFFQNINRNYVISFDIFDALVDTSCFKPEDIFYLMELDSRVSSVCPNFSKFRMQAERQVREKILNKEEITLKDIYEQFAKIRNFDKKDALLLEMIEVDMEIQVSKYRPLGKKIYDYALAQNKKIILISDANIPEYSIVKILNKNGYTHWDKLYLSSSEQKINIHFSPFKEILNSYNQKDILHIGGDKYNSKYQNPMTLGISVISLPNPQNLFLNESDKFIDLLRLYKSSSDIAASIVLKHIVSSDKGLSFPSDASFANSSFEFGRGILGALAFMFSHWLKGKCEEHNVRNLFFLSRDGKLFHDAFQLLFPDAGINIRYVFASRKNNKIINRKSVEVIISELLKAQSDQELLDILKFSFGLTDAESKELLIYEEKKLAYQQIAETLCAKAELMRKSYFEYLRGYCKTGAIAVVDIGYMGSTQKVISELFGEDIFGFYLSVDSGIQKNIKAGRFYSFIEEPQRGNSNIGIVRHRHIYETILCSNDKSFISMIKDKEDFDIRFSNFNEPNRQGFIESSHKGALIGVKELSKNLSGIAFSPNKIPLFYFDALLNNPNNGMIDIFNGLEFEDNNSRKVVISKDKNFPNSMELWKEAVLFKQGKDLKSFGRWRKVYLFVESVMIYIFSSQRKYKKYRKNRIGYLLDSKSSILRFLAKL